VDRGEGCLIALIWSGTAALTMQRTFLYDFQPSHLDPVGGCVVGLSVNAIEDAALREVLQTPGAAFATWSLFDRLLEPGTPGAPFRFLNPLGQAREVKVALSGLFGRFVARAYLETHMNLSFFAHLGPSTTQLNSGKKLRIKKVGTGDLPDWLACSSHLSNLTVAEAKGCHDRPGPGNALQRAWTQAKRVSVVAKGAPVPLKRVAIATRWGSVSGGVSEPMLWVRDPDEPGAEILREDKEAIFVGIVRRHIAGFLSRLGFPELSETLFRLGTAPYARTVANARDLWSRATSTWSAADVAGHEFDGLLGGVVTRAGPIPPLALNFADARTLSRLDLRPLFVGIESDVVKASIEGEAERLLSVLQQVPTRRQSGRYDGAGGWIIPIGLEE
jgi:hypothetical protein